MVIGLLVCLVVGLTAIPAQAQEQPTEDKVVKAAIEKGVAWLAQQQDADGFWPESDWCAVTALAVKKLEHHAVDPKWGFGLDSPFHEDYPYRKNVENGLRWLFENCPDRPIPISPQPAGDPDSDGDGIGVTWSRTGHPTYTSGIALMTICEAVELDRVVETGPLAGWTYEDVARDTMDYLAFGQNDWGSGRGGWGYAENECWPLNGEMECRSDNSNTGYVTLGLGFAEADKPAGCGFADLKDDGQLHFVKKDLDIWIDYIQNDTGEGWYEDPLGGSGYDHPESWVNILKTGNLLQQMALVGDDKTTDRVQDALDYLARHWGDPDQDPGWRDGPYTSSYQATFTTMKGLTSLGLYKEFGDPPIPWQADFEDELVAEQIPAPDDPEKKGYWSGCDWGGPILCTTWALLTLQKVAPPPPEIKVPVDIKPMSCPNPLNVKSRGVLPVAILGTEDFDVTQIEPSGVVLQLPDVPEPIAVPALRWDIEDVATPFEPEEGQEVDRYFCTDAGPDGYDDLTLKFDRQAVVAAIGGDELSDGDVVFVEVAGALKEEFGGTPVVGKDVVWIIKKGEGGKK